MHQYAQLPDPMFSVVLFIWAPEWIQIGEMQNLLGKGDANAPLAQTRRYLVGAFEPGPSAWLAVFCTSFS